MHAQISAPDRRVLRLVEEIAKGPLPGWQPVPCLLVLNKVRLVLGFRVQRLGFREECVSMSICSHRMLASTP